MSEANGNGKAEVTDLYRKHRPRLLKHVVGQDAAVKVLKELLASGRFPHALLLSGPSGTGKTTLARILQKKLDCSDSDFAEINCGVIEPMDTVRAITARVGLSALGGSRRVYYLDECQALSRAPGAQQAALKLLEDCPPHVHFFLASTEPEKILRAVRTRCVEVKLEPLTPEHLRGVITDVAAKEGVEVGTELAAAIAEAAEGSARSALNLLQSVIALPTEDERLAAVAKPNQHQKAMDLVRILLWQKIKWPEVRKMLDGLVEENPEDIRRLIVANLGKAMLKGDQTAERAFDLWDRCFREPYRQGGKADHCSLVAGCYEAYLMASGKR